MKQILFLIIIKIVLTNSFLINNIKNSNKRSTLFVNRDDGYSKFRKSLYYNEENDKEESGDVPIPRGGISIKDEMDKENEDKFTTELISTNVPGVATIITETIPKMNSIEPLRYIVAIDNPEEIEQKKNLDKKKIIYQDFVMIDVPPISDKLIKEMKSFMKNPITYFTDDSTNDDDDDDDVNENNGVTKIVPRLLAILITNRHGIHYDQASSTYKIRSAELKLWKDAFYENNPNLQIISTRLDTPRDCQPYITQRLDGNGPFAMNDNTTIYDSNNEFYNHVNEKQEMIDDVIKNDDKKNKNYFFMETGRPLSYQDMWDHDVALSVLKGQQMPPDDIADKMKEEKKDEVDCTNDDDDSILYTAESIKLREKDKKILAVMTPGYTFGSVSYIFPKRMICCSGCTIPIEDPEVHYDVDSDHDKGENIMRTSPILDYRGFITTSKAGITKQIHSCKSLINDYIDRFYVVLPSRGDPLYLPHSISETTTSVLQKNDHENETEEEEEVSLEVVRGRRKKDLLYIIDVYEKVGKVYEDLGISP